MFVSCVLCLCSAFCVMLGANTMLGAMDNMEFINVLCTFSFKHARPSAFLRTEVMCHGKC